jgi:hypothetical protein
VTPDERSKVEQTSSRLEEQMRGRRTFWLVGAVALAAMGCRDALSPADYEGEYVLIRVAGEALPALLFDNDLVSGFAIADTIRLRADGSGSRIHVARYDGIASSLASRAPNNSVSNSELHFQVVGGVLEITYVCPPNADCAAGPHALAVRTAAGLNITREGINRSPQEFVAIGAR